MLVIDVYPSFKPDKSTGLSAVEKFKAPTPELITDNSFPSPYVNPVYVLVDTKLVSSGNTTFGFDIANVLVKNLSI